jgi:hypothetical protein
MASSLLSRAQTNTHTPLLLLYISILEVWAHRLVGRAGFSTSSDCSLLLPQQAAANHYFGYIPATPLHCENLHGINF